MTVISGGPTGGVPLRTAITSDLKAPAAINPADDPDAALRGVARQLEGVFVEHLFRAMRDTVPEGGLTDGGSGEEIFTGMLDQQLADSLAAGWDRGLGTAIYRQLRAVTHSTETVDTLPQPGRGE
jgi:flagellar protein FlgJ